MGRGPRCELADRWPGGPRGGVHRGHPRCAARRSRVQPCARRAGVGGADRGYRAGQPRGRALADRVGRRRSYATFFIVVAVAGAVVAAGAPFWLLLVDALTGALSTDVVDNGPA